VLFRSSEDSANGIVKKRFKSKKDATTPFAKNQEKHQVKTSSDDLDKSLEVDLKKLKSISGGANKEAYKKESLIGKYLPSAKDLVDSGLEITNSWFVYLLIWLFDIDDIAKAFEYGVHGMKKAVEMPTKFNRDFPTFFFDQVFDWAKRQFEENMSVSPYFDDGLTMLFEDSEVSEFCITTKIHEKFAKLKAEICLNENNYELAVFWYEIVYHYDDKAKIKTNYEKALEGMNS